MAKKKRPAPKKKTVKKKTAGKKTATTKKAVTQKGSDETAATKKAAAKKKTTAKPAAAKKAASRKTAKKKATPKPTTNQNSTTGKTATKKPATKKTATKTATVKAPAAKKKATAKNKTTKKATTGKATTTKPAVKKTVTKAAAGKAPAAKKKTKRKAVVRKKSARRARATPAESTVQTSAETTYDPRQMTLFDKPDQLWSDRAQPKKRTTKSKSERPDSRHEDSTTTSGVAGVERSEPPEQSKEELGAHSIRPQPLEAEQQPVPASRTETKPNHVAPATPETPVATAVSDVVDYLEREGVLRSGIDPDSGRNVVQLYHDYLSRAVIEAERRADRWPTVLRDARKQFGKAGSSLIRRWRALLSPWQQLRLLVERLRPGVSFSYGRHKNFAACSLFRFLPYVVVLVVFLLTWQYQHDHSEARRIVTDILGKDGRPSPEEYEALESLADSPKGVRLAFIDQTLENEAVAKSLQYRYAYVLHAVVGLDEAMRDQVRDRLLDYGTDASDNSTFTNIAIAKLGVALSITDDDDLNRVIGASYVAEMQKNTDTDTLSSLCRALGSLGDNLDATAAAADRIVAVIQETTDTDTLSSLFRALSSLGDNLDATSAAPATKQILAAMKEITYADRLPHLGRALGSLCAGLDATSAAPAAKQILADMKETDDDTHTLDSQGHSLGDRLDANSAAAGAEQILAAMKETTDTHALDSQGHVLGSLDTRGLMSVLKSTVCVGETRTFVLAAIKQRAGWPIDGDIWMAVAWAKEEGVDVMDEKAVPRWPLAR